MQTGQTRKIKIIPESLASFLLAVLISATVGFGGGWLGARSYQQSESNLPASGQQVVLNESQLISDLAKKVGPSVVSIDVISRQSTGFFGFFDGFERAGAGTGIIISSDGYIITNRHVVPVGTSNVSVTLSDGTRFEDVDVIGRTSTNDSLDIAFLKIKGLGDTKLEVATLGDSSELSVGDKVIAIGNALGQFQNSITAGIVSGFGRSVTAGDSFSSENLQNLIQTDAAINEGNSGGPLVNISGEVIGINTAIAGGGAQGIGFAIPTNDIQSLVASVLEKGILERPYLGVRYVTLTEAYAKELGLSVTVGAYIVPESAGVSSILHDSPAQKAGLQSEDVVTKVNNEQVDNKNSLSSLIGRKRVGEVVTLTVVRAGEELTVKVTLESAPER